MGYRLSPEVPLPPEVPAVDFQYDSDFSEASTVPASDSEDDDIDPRAAELLARVPKYCWYPPSIPAGRFIWNCPGCEYSIDFLNLKKCDLEALSEEEGRYMAQKMWKSMHDEEVRMAFTLMSAKHYFEHMHNRGVDIVQRRDKASRPSPCVNVQGLSKRNLVFSRVRREGERLGLLIS